MNSAICNLKSEICNFDGPRSRAELRALPPDDPWFSPAPEPSARDLALAQAELRSHCHPNLAICNLQSEI